MKTLAHLLLVAAFATASALAQDADAVMESAIEAFDAEDYTKALKLLDPLLKVGGDPPVKAVQIASAALHRRGEDHFRNGRVVESVADFDHELQLTPNYEPSHWQRGISQYYAKQYEAGVAQFEIHKTVNPNDVENAVWHFLCAVRAPGGTVEKARKNLIPIKGDSRIPMAEVHRMFAGELTPEDVLKAGATGGGRGEFYANLYVGLFYEAIGEDEKAMQFIAKSSTGVFSQNYMGDVARTHLIVREREKKAAEGKE